MATLVSRATGNFTDAATWGVGNTTALQITGTSSTQLGTSYSYSSNFTPGAIEVDGILVQIAARASSPSGTVTISLRNVTGAVEVKEVTINVSDLDSNGNGWYFFKFDAAVTLLAATNYAVGAKTSASAQVTLFRDATANNWNRVLRTTTTGAPAASDRLFVAGEHTGAGTGNDLTVTMNNNTSTSFGAIDVNKRGTLTWTTGSTTQLRHAGNLTVYGAGTLSVGTSGTPIDSAAIARLEPDCGSNVQYGYEFKAGCVVNMYGASRSFWYTRLSATEAAGQTVLSVADNTGWVNGDEVWIAGTNPNSRQGEKRTISSTGATDITVTSGLTNSHAGTNTNGQDRRAHVGLLTRNLRIIPVNSSFGSYVYCGNSVTINLRWVEIQNFGSNTTNKRAAIHIDAVGGTIDARNCAFHSSTQSSARGVYLSAQSLSGATFNIQDNVIANLTGASSVGIDDSSMDAAGVTVSGNLVMRSASNSGFTNSNAFTTWSSNVFNDSGGNGLNLAYPGQVNGVTHGSVTNNIAYGNANAGIVFAPHFGGDSKTLTFSGNEAWNNLNYGFSIASSSGPVYVTIQSCKAWDNQLAGFGVGACVATIKDCVIDGGFEGSQSYGVSVISTYAFLTIVNTTFGATQTHTNDIRVDSGFGLQADCYNCLFASSTEVNFNANCWSNSYVASDKHDQTAGSYILFKKAGRLIRNTADADADACIEFQGLSTTDAIAWIFPVKADSGVEKTVNVKLKKSATYNGNNPTISATFLGSVVEGPNALSITTSWASYAITIPAGDITEDGVLWITVSRTGNITGRIFADTLS